MVAGAPPEVFVGQCPRCAREHHLINNVPLAFTSLATLFEQLRGQSSWLPLRTALDDAGGKMVGVLIADDNNGKRHVLRGFSGDVGGTPHWPDFVGPIFRREDTAALEAQTLATLKEIEGELAQCNPIRARALLAEVEREVKEQASLRRATFRADQHAHAGQTHVLAELLRRNKDAISAERARVSTAKRAVMEEDGNILRLKALRRTTSARLMAAMFDAAAFTNAHGERSPLRDIFVGTGIPSGTGECVVPKLLDAANRARLTPVAMAEAWWGPEQNGRRHGEIQPPCTRKCAPILGHLLCGVDAP